jgi:hypothetical protein
MLVLLQLPPPPRIEFWSEYLKNHLEDKSVDRRIEMNRKALNMTHLARGRNQWRALANKQ